MHTSYNLYVHPIIMGVTSRVGDRVSEFAVIADDTTDALDSVAHFAHAGPVALLLDPQDNHK